MNFDNGTKLTFLSFIILALIPVAIESAAIEIEEDGRSVIGVGSEVRSEQIRLSEKQRELNRRLIEFAEDGDIAGVNLVLEEGADVNDSSPYNYTALTHAADKGHADIVKILVERVTDVNHIGSALRSDARKAHMPIVRMLLGKCSLEDRLICWNILLFVAASNSGDIAVVKTAIEEGADVNNADEEGWTVLMRAAGEGHAAIVEILLDNGANIDATNKYNQTALMRAASQGCTNVVEILLKRSPNFNVRERDDRYTAIMESARHGHTDIFKILLERGAYFDSADEEEVFRNSARDGHRDIVDIILERGVNIDARDFSGQTALIKAARCGRKGIVELLLDRGADVDARGKEGHTALTEAVDSGNMDTAKILLNAGADVNLTGRYGKTALCILANFSRIPDMVVAKDLLDKGADVNIKGDYSHRAIIGAAGNGHTDLVIILLDVAGHCINVEDKCEALREAAREGRVGVVKALLESGADVNSASEYGGTPLSQVLRGSFNRTEAAAIETTEVLLEAGADIPEDTSRYPQAIRDLFEREQEIRVSRRLVKSAAKKFAIKQVMQPEGGAGGV